MLISDRSRTTREISERGRRGAARRARAREKAARIAKRRATTLARKFTRTSETAGVNAGVHRQRREIFSVSCGIIYAGNCGGIRRGEPAMPAPRAHTGERRVFPALPYGTGAPRSRRANVVVRAFFFFFFGAVVNFPARGKGDRAMNAAS